MTDREIMQQALGYMESVGKMDMYPEEWAIAVALRERLAQPEQEPVLQDIEQYLMQMAGICTAAVGYWKEGDGIHPDYDTPALRDVARLYAKYDALYKAQSEQEPVACRVCGDERGSWAWQCNHCGAFDESPQPRKPDHIVDVTKMVPFQDLAAELFVVAQISPADDGFSDTITRIEAWLRNHFSIPPQRKPLTDEQE